MVASLRSLLDRVIDYAGLFPPAQLDMSRSVAEYLRQTQGPDAWFVGRFVCPSTRLDELQDTLASSPGAPEIPIAVAGGASENLDGWYQVLEHDANVMNEFVQAVGEKAAIEAYEVRIPENRYIGACIGDLKSFQEVDVFVELPWGQGLDDSLAAIAETEWLCAKARTGGATPGAVPSAGDLAGFLHGAVGLDLSFKLTAGLHHPLPRVDRDTGAKMHGFLNVLSACGFALAEDMSRNEIQELLTSASVEDWRFEPDRIRWRDASLTLEDIEDSRELFWSIGSCSVEEPLNDLDALGLITGGR